MTPWGSPPTTTGLRTMQLVTTLGPITLTPILPLGIVMTVPGAVLVLAFVAAGTTRAGIYPRVCSGVLSSLPILHLPAPSREVSPVTLTMELLFIVMTKLVFDVPKVLTMVRVRRQEGLVGSLLNMMHLPLVRLTPVAIRVVSLAVLTFPLANIVIPVSLLIRPASPLRSLLFLKIVFGTSNAHRPSTAPLLPSTF